MQVWCVAMQFEMFSMQENNLKPNDCSGAAALTDDLKEKYLYKNSQKSVQSLRTTQTKYLDLDIYSKCI